MRETSLGSASVEQEVALFRLPHLMFLRSPSKERKEERKLKLRADTFPKITQHLDLYADLYNSKIHALKIG